MIHVFLYALPTNNSKDARIAELAAVRVKGFGPYKKTDIEKAYHGVASEQSVGVSSLLDAVKTQVLPPAGPYILVSYSEITRALIRLEYDRLKLDNPLATRAWTDIYQLVWPLLATNQIQARSIAALSKHFGVTYEAKKGYSDDGDSADTCTALIQIYGALMRRYRTALAGESVLRDIGGESLEGLRNMMGF